MRKAKKVSPEQANLIVLIGTLIAVFLISLF